MAKQRLDSLDKILIEFGRDQRNLRVHLAKTIKRRLQNKFEQHVYSIVEITNSLNHLGFEYSSEDILRYAEGESLAVYSGVLYPWRKNNEGTPYVLESRVPKLLTEMDLPIDYIDLELSRKHLKWRAYL